MIRLDSTSRRRSSSDTAEGLAWFSKTGWWSSAYLWNSTLTGTHPSRTVSHVQVWAMRSQAFSSSRTLPGQGYRMNAWSTAGEIARGSSPRWRKYRFTKWSTRIGMSSRRSRRGGRFTGMTLSR